MLKFDRYGYLLIAPSKLFGLQETVFTFIFSFVVSKSCSLLRTPVVRHGLGWPMGPWAALGLGPGSASTLETPVGSGRTYVQNF